MFCLFRTFVGLIEAQTGRPVHQRYGPTGEDDLQRLLPSDEFADLRIDSVRSADPSRTRGFTFWTEVWSLFLPGLVGSFTLRVRGWRVAMWGERV